MNKVLTTESFILDVLPSRQEAGKNSAMELGKVLTPESRLLHVVPGRQEADENRCSGTGQGAYPGEPPSPCCARQTRSGWEQVQRK